MSVNFLHYRPTVRTEEVVHINAIQALKNFKQALADGYYGFSGPVDHVVIKTDSSYLVNSVTKWIIEWRRNGRVNFNGYRVSNQDLITEPDRLCVEGPRRSSMLLASRARHEQRCRSAGETRHPLTVLRVFLKDLPTSDDVNPVICWVLLSGRGGWHLALLLPKKMHRRHRYVAALFAT